MRRVRFRPQARAEIREARGWYESSVACLGFLYCALILFNSNGAPQGWASLMVVVLVLGGLTMTMLGILGEYLWRALEESRNRPQFLIETYLDQRQVAIHQPLPLSRTNEIL